jgi:AAA family ATP:ADP antiporter
LTPSASGQAPRLFAFIAAGASVGGLVGPTFSALLMGVISEAGLVLVAAALLGLGLAGLADRPASRATPGWRRFPRCITLAPG